MAQEPEDDALGQLVNEEDSSESELEVETVMHLMPKKSRIMKLIH